MSTVIHLTEADATALFRTAMRYYQEAGGKPEELPYELMRLYNAMRVNFGLHYQPDPTTEQGWKFVRPVWNCERIETDKL